LTSDRRNFTAPWDYPTTWAQPELRLSVLEENENCMAYYNAGPIYANIIGLSI
jgi:hypothetical protein